MYRRHELDLGGSTERGNLYLNDKEIATGVTSFFIHSDFLMVTTVKHTLKSLPLEQLVQYQNDNMWSQESVRALGKYIFVFPILSH